MNLRGVRLDSPRFRRAAYKGCVAALLILAATGCPGSLNNLAEFLDAVNSEGGVGLDGGTCNAPDTIFTPTCGVAGCHNPTSQSFAGNLDLVSPNLASRLVNVPANEMPSLLLINSADPGQSALLTKLSSPPPFGAQMPYLGKPLSADQIQCVADWIAAQASGSSGSAGEAGLDDASSSTSSSGASTSSSSSSSSGTTTSSTSSSSSSSSSSGGSSGEMDGGAISFATVYSTIIQGTCTGHHSGSNPSGGLDMSSEMAAFTNLTTGSSSAMYEPGCNEQFVVQGNAAKSLLYQKVVGGTKLPKACGAQMPKGETPLSEADVTLIEDWIQGGAAP